MNIPLFIYPFYFCWAFVFFLVWGSSGELCHGLSTTRVLVSIRCVSAGYTPKSGLVVRMAYVCSAFEDTGNCSCYLDSPNNV